jgi:hypothetical protein
MDDTGLMLSELSGYKIYAGSNAESLELVDEIWDHRGVAYDFYDLEGTVTVAVTAVDFNGVESGFSALATGSFL